MDTQKIEETLESLVKRVGDLENREMLYSNEKRVNELEKKDIKKVSKKVSYIEPDLQDDYWYIDSEGNINKDLWLRTEKDLNRLYFNNVFVFECDAEFELERLRVYRELRRYSVNGVRHKNCYSIGIDFEKRELVYIPTGNTEIKQGLLLFETEEQAKKAIKAVGIDRLFEYYIEFSVY